MSGIQSRELRVSLCVLSPFVVLLVYEGDPVTVSVNLFLFFKTTAMME